jgi:hypothetical protein
VYQPQKRSAILRAKVDCDVRGAGLERRQRGLFRFPSPGERNPAMRYNLGEDSNGDIAPADLYPKRSADLDIQDV